MFTSTQEVHTMLFLQISYKVLTHWTRRYSWVKNNPPLKAEHSLGNNAKYGKHSESADLHHVLKIERFRNSWTNSEVFNLKGFPGSKPWSGSIPILNQLKMVIIRTISWKFKRNPSSTFWVILKTYKETKQCLYRDLFIFIQLCLLVPYVVRVRKKRPYAAQGTYNSQVCWNVIEIKSKDLQ